MRKWKSQVRSLIAVSLVVGVPQEKTGRGGSHGQ